MNRRRIVLATATSAVATLTVQLVALVSLNPPDYGFFSIMYLAGAWSLSVHLSVVSEAWARSDLAGVPSGWRSYAGATTYLGAAGAVVSLLIALLVPQLRETAWLSALAVWASVYRSGARFHSMRLSDWSGVLIGDVVGALVAVAGSVVIAMTHGGLVSVMVVWASASVAGALASRQARPTGPGVLVDWVRRHRPSIRVLLADSLIMDLSSIGTPYALAPVLGVANFGVYRGVSNVAAPVRLILNPLRPQISVMSRERLSRRSTLLALASASLAFGVGAAGALILLRNCYPHLGTLTELAEFAAPTGAFVAANMFGHSYYLIARNHGSTRGIWTGRLVQTLLTMVLPITAAVAWGLTGAIWTIAAATLLSAINWCAVATGSGPYRPTREVPPERD